MNMKFMWFGLTCMVGTVGVDFSPLSAQAFEHARLHPWNLRTVLNSGFGPAQDGGFEKPDRGAALALRGGGTLRIGLLEAQLSPMVLLRHRLDQTPGRNRIEASEGPFIAQQQGGLDWTLAAPPGTALRIAFPESRLGARLGLGPHRALSAALTNERVQWGPGYRNPLILSGLEGGFPHVVVRADLTRAFEMEWLVGELTESKGFDREAENDRRQLVGFAAAVRPGVAPGLTLGAVGVQHRTLAGGERALSGWKALLELPRSLVAETLDDNLDGNALGSVFAQWAPPGTGLAFYAEFARDDHAEGLEDLTLEPDHARAWLVGFERTLELNSGRPLTLLAEFADTRSPAGTLGRRAGGVGVQFYTNGSVVQGHTHRGRLMGAPLGPGARTTFVQVRLDPQVAEGEPPARNALARTAWATTAWAAIEHTEYGADAHRTRYAPTYGKRGRDLEWTLWLGGTLPELGTDGSLQGTFGLTRRENRAFHAFQGGGASSPAGATPNEGVRIPVELNLHLTLEYRTRFGLRSRAEASLPEPRRLGAR
jgi:hypothetical protein